MRAMPATIVLGNTAVVVPAPGAEAVTHAGSDAPAAPDSATPRPDLSQQITTISLGEGGGLADVVAVWAAHSSADPAWVEGDDEDLVAQVASHYSIPVGCPDNGDPDVHNHETWKEA
jgi:hypothetical protein